LLLVFISLLLGSTARKKIKLKLYLLFYILRAKKLAYLQIFKSSNLQIFKSSNLQIFKSSNYLNKKTIFQSSWPCHNTPVTQLFFFITLLTQKNPKPENPYTQPIF